MEFRRVLFRSIADPHLGLFCGAQDRKHQALVIRDLIGRIRRFHWLAHVSPKYRSKKAASLSSTACFLVAWPLPFENRDTGGRILVMAVPVEGMLPSRKALSMKLWVASAFKLSSAIIRSSFSAFRSEEHTSELQSLLRISYAVFCLNK